MTTMTSENLAFHNLPGSILSNPNPIHPQHQFPPQQPLLSSLLTTFPSPSNGTSLLKLSNVPSDISKREATIIFALVIDEIVNIEVNDFVIYAYFKNINTCLTTAKLLDGKFIFGNEYPPVKVDYDSSLQSPPNAFNQNQSAQPNIQPPQSQQPPNQPNTVQPPPSQPNQIQNQPNQPQIQPNQGQGQIPNGFDNFQKRQSIGNQRSRFVFSDPFSGNANNNPLSSIQPSQPAAIDLSELTGKSILLMESQNDAREYDNLVRDPWGSTPSSANPNSNSLPLTSAPQTPGLNSHFDWNNNNSNGASNGTDRRRTSSAFFHNNPSMHSLQPSLQQPQNQQTQNQQNQQNQSQQAQNSQSQQSQQSQQPQQPQQPDFVKNQQNQSQSQPPLSSTSSGPTAAGIISAQQQQSSLQAAQTGLSNLNVSMPKSKPASQELNSNSTSNYSVNSVNNPSTSVNPVSNSSSNSVSNPVSASGSSSRQSSSTNLKEVPDLSLLARVPPPANPADQNPPCNTLYVGNLPPDATEAELRALFAPQKGFRRLSFRTKNQSQSGGPNGGSSNHNHGPMCFVEFEDVAHATRALAELYGRALPRPNGSNGKGGIRLSFSKNPLGVRGPGNPRRASANQIPTTTSAPPVGNISNGGVGNYGYSSYHQK